MTPPAYPRPQLVREQWPDLCGFWGFAHDDLETGRRDGWAADAGPFDRTIQVPYPPESRRSEIADTAVHPVVWYRRELDLTPPTADERVLLHFGAVDYRAEVWVNGQPVGGHEGGTPRSAST